MEKIIPGKHVTLVYDLYAIEPDGETLVHQSDPKDPEQIIFGVTKGVIVPLEQAIDGLSKGDTFDVTATSDQAFGPHIDEEIVSLDKDMFEIDGKFDSEIVAVGKYVPMLTEDGFRMNGLVTAITDDKVTLDFNHPLAGKDVRFKGKIQDVRDATPEELHLATNQGCGCQGGGCGGGCSEGSCEEGEGSCCCKGGC